VEIDTDTRTDRGAGAEQPCGWLARAEASAWDLAPDDRRLLALLDELVADRRAAGVRDPVVLVVTDRPDERLALLVDADLVEPSAVGASELRLRLATGARPDLVVLDTADLRRRRALLLPLAFVVPRGGALLVARSRLGVTDAAESTMRQVTGLLEPTADEPAAPGVRAMELPHIAAGWRDVRLAGDHLVLRNALRSLVTLAEREADVALRRSPERGRVLATLPGGRFEPRGTLNESDSPAAGRWRTAYDVPDLSLRRYVEVVCRPGGVVTQGHVLLPESHRHIARRRPNNRFAPTVSSTAARLRRRVPVARDLEEPHFFWDSEFRGHFGHVMTEMLSRLWALDEARRHHPGLRILMATSPNKEADLTAHEVAVLAAFGVVPEEITFLREPARVRTLLAATPMFSQPEVVHPEIAAVWDRLGDHLAGQAPDRLDGRPYPRRIFVSRRGGLRACRNAAEVEALFAGAGFAVVHPEAHRMAVQARLFREADVIAGYAGSGLFNAMLADTPKRLVMISSETYTVQNEWMIAAVRGHHVDVAWSRPDRLDRPDVGEARSPARPGTLHAPYSVDPEREGLFLRKVLAEL